LLAQVLCLLVLIAETPRRRVGACLGPASHIRPACPASRTRFGPSPRLAAAWGPGYDVNVQTLLMQRQ
jgi:hypothetical protein